MKKILDNYSSVDEQGAQVIAERCLKWQELGVSEPNQIIGEILAGGGTITNGVVIGEYLFGNMYNPDRTLGLIGSVWCTSIVLSTDKDDEGRQWVTTASGSRYLLLGKRPERSFEEILSRIYLIAPEPFAEYLEDHVSFWAPEIRWGNLTNAVKAYVEPSSKDPCAIEIYSLLCACTKSEMARRFEKDGF